VFGIYLVLTLSVPTINKVYGLILDGHRIGQENLVEDDYTGKEIDSDKLASISIQLTYM
jgi:hypothetical protein